MKQALARVERADAKHKAAQAELHDALKELEEATKAAYPNGPATSRPRGAPPRRRKGQLREQILRALPADMAVLQTVTGASQGSISNALRRMRERNEVLLSEDGRYYEQQPMVTVEPNAHTEPEEEVDE